MTLSFLGVTLLGGLLSLGVGTRLISRAVFSEAYTRVRQDLNVAREIYRSRGERIAAGLAVTSFDTAVQAAMEVADQAFLTERARAVAAVLGLDFAGFVATDGTTLSRLREDAASGDIRSAPPPSLALNPVVLDVLASRAARAGTVVLEQEALAAEDEELARRARIEAVATPRAAPSSRVVETRGLSITAATPVYRTGRFLGVVYGGILLNRNTDIVDKVRDTVFQGEAFQERRTGTATIFLSDLRVSTNVMSREGSRAIGTRVSEEVRRKVLDQGASWSDRAFVVDDWYISAYEPIEDTGGETVGILYVGVLERKYAAIYRDTIAVFVLLTFAGVVVSIALGSTLGGRLLRPILELAALSSRVSQGDLSPRVSRFASAEVGQLQRTFNQMVSSLAERETRQREESDAKLLHSEQQASVGRLAAGVAHEINNPLTGTLTFTHLLLRRTDLPEDVHKDLEVIARSTERVREIVRGLLDFSRQTQLHPEPIDLNELTRNAVALIENQALLKGVRIRFEAAEGLPKLTVDRSQMQSVVLNLVLNAIDATDSGGLITVSVSAAVVADARQGDGSALVGVQIVVADTGCGVPPEHLPKLFEPFFTTKDVGKGTGMGLSVSLGIVEKHGGTIRVTSTVGKGSTFVIWLPQATGGYGP